MVHMQMSRCPTDKWAGCTKTRQTGVREASCVISNTGPGLCTYTFNEDNKQSSTVLCLTKPFHRQSASGETVTRSSQPTLMNDTIKSIVFLWRNTVLLANTDLVSPTFFIFVPFVPDWFRPTTVWLTNTLPGTSATPGSGDTCREQDWYVNKGLTPTPCA